MTSLNTTPTNAPTNSVPFHPDQNYQFPTSYAGKQKRSCQWQWFINFPWLDYNEEIDSVTCFTCKKQNFKENLVAKRLKESVFLESGFHNWKKALTKFEKTPRKQVSPCCCSS